MSPHDSHVQSLNSYFLDFLRRTHPLEMGSIESALKPVEEEFERDWKEGKVDGWQKKSIAAGVGSNGAEGGGGGEGIWCAACEYSVKPNPNKFCWLMCLTTVEQVRSITQNRQCTTHI